MNATARAARSEKFELFAECLFVGVLVTAAALPIITALPALAAGCAQIRAHLSGERTEVRVFAANVRLACRGSLRMALLFAAAFVLLMLDLVLVARTDLPAEGLVTAVCLLAIAGLAVIGLRSAAAWSPGADWGGLVRAASRRAIGTDLRGSLLLLMALFVALLVARQLVPLLVPMLGCLVMAVVAIEHRLRSATD